MKLEKAIEIQTLLSKGNPFKLPEANLEAIKLLIEAGKAVQKVRETTYWRPTKLLPGETG